MSEQATKRPWRWRYEDDSMMILVGPDEDMDVVLAATKCKACFNSPRRCFQPTQADAALIVEAVNKLAAHKRLQEAAERALEHVEELREAWMTGALSEHDGKGGMRSNRNVDVEVSLRKALGANSDDN